MNKSNLAMFYDKLVNNIWLINPTVHNSMMKQVDGYITNPVPLTKMETEYTPSPASDTPLDDGLSHGIIWINGAISKGVSAESEELLGLVDIDWISQTLQVLAQDESIKDIICVFRSPGGEPTGIEECGRLITHIDQNIKPVYGFTDDVCGSAAYWLCSQARSIGMTNSAVIGGVGVYLLTVDNSEALKKAGCQIHPIWAGTYKLLGQEFKALTDDEEKILQDRVNTQYKQFTETVKSKRTNISEDDMQGLAYFGNDALSKGFADTVCDSLDEFIKKLDESDKTNIFISSNSNIMNVQTSKVKASVAEITQSPEVKPEVKIETQAIGVKEEPLTRKEFASMLQTLMSNVKVEVDNDDEGESEYCECKYCNGTGKMKKELEATKVVETKLETPVKKSSYTLNEFRSLVGIQPKVENPNTMGAFTRKLMNATK